MSIQEKLTVLRQHETYCFQIAYYLLQNKDLAMFAAELALLELSKKEDFLLGLEEVQTKMAKHESMRSSLVVKRSRLINSDLKLV